MGVGKCLLTRNVGRVIVRGGISNINRGASADVRKLWLVYIYLLFPVEVKHPPTFNKVDSIEDQAKESQRHY